MTILLNPLNILTRKLRVGPEGQENHGVTSLPLPPHCEFMCRKGSFCLKLIEKFFVSVHFESGSFMRRLKKLNLR